MSTPWFFLSYASISQRNDNQVKAFCSDLVEALRVEASLEERNVPSEEIGFYAPTSLAGGQKWPAALVENLRKCRVLVCLYSDKYFQSEMCGKEFTIFNSRVEAYARTLASAEPPPLFVPVLWVTPTDFPDSLPRAVAELQYDSYIDKQRSVGGLFYLRTLSEHQGEYARHVVHLARTIKAVVEQHVLPPLEKVPSFHEAWNAWVDPPAAPRALEATLTAPRQISLNWEDNPTDADGFYVERFRDGGRPDFIKIKELGAGESRCTDANVAAGTKYRYRVCAFNSGGCSSYVESGDVETTGQPPPPMPTELSGSALWTFRIGLSWTDNSGGTGSFKIERCNDRAGGSFQQIVKTDPGVTLYKDRVLWPRHTHVYRVCAFDANGDSDYSNEVKVSTLKPFLPLLLLIAIAAAAVVVSIPKLREVVISPFYTPTPTPTPTPVVVELYPTLWEDDFSIESETQQPNSNEWKKRKDWELPTDNRWELVPGMEGKNSDNKAILVKGMLPGIVGGKNFSNFEADFEIQLVAGSRAGWVIHAQGNQQSGYVGYFFVLETPSKEGNSIWLRLYARLPAEEKAALVRKGYRDTPLGLEVDSKDTGITEHSTKSNDRITVHLKAAGDKFTYTFRLQNSNSTDKRLDLKRSVPCEINGLANLLSVGYFGLFAGDDATQFKVEIVRINPQP